MGFRATTLSCAIMSVALIGAAMTGPAAPAFAAAQVEAFSQTAFDAAQKSERPILVHITAPWCSVCRAQNDVLGRLFEESKFKDLITFNIDFDSQKALVQKFGATMQSTLIVYKGAKEEGRLVGVSDSGPIEGLLSKAE